MQREDLEQSNVFAALFTPIDHDLHHVLDDIPLVSLREAVASQHGAPCLANMDPIHYELPADQNQRANFAIFVEVVRGLARSSPSLPLLPSVIGVDAVDLIAAIILFNTRSTNAFYRFICRSLTTGSLFFYRQFNFAMPLNVGLPHINKVDKGNLPFNPRAPFFDSHWAHGGCASDGCDIAVPETADRSPAVVATNTKLLLLGESISHRQCCC